MQDAKALHTVAIEAAAEATKLSELSVERVAWRLRERGGRNATPAQRSHPKKQLQEPT